MLNELYLNNLNKLVEKAFDYRHTRLKPSEWIEKTIYLSKELSNYAGYYKFDISPYIREVVDCLDPSSDIEQVAVMKCVQSGFTAGLIVPGIAYVISENPGNAMFLSGTDDLVKNTIRDRLDIVLEQSKLSHLLRPSVQKLKGQRTGNTDYKKEYSGGSLTAVTYTPSKLRQYSIKYVFADEFDDAPKTDIKEGSIRKLLEGRTTSFGTTKKLFFVSSPTTEQTSNIKEVYEMGDKRKWAWCCPHCNEYIIIEWKVEVKENVYAGMKWKLDDKGKVIEDSIHYECQNCGGAIAEEQKYELNLTGKWIPTAEPEQKSFRSYLLNAITIPPGFDGWFKLVSEFVKACPPGQPENLDLLKSFVNTRLGQTWVERGKEPKVHQLMSNTQNYDVGIVPNVLSQQQGNGNIALVSLAMDLGGVMEAYNEDVRIDWEIIAHTTNGQEYHIDHGSIGTFKRVHKRTKQDIEDDSKGVREKMTYAHNVKNSVWPEVEKLIKRTLVGQNGQGFDIDITVIDTGHFTKLAYDFINSMNDPFIVGIKGDSEVGYRNNSKDTAVFKRSNENRALGYILQTNQLKDIVSDNMKLRQEIDGYQPVGFMNFPVSASKDKYQMKSYFAHYEGEHRVEEIKNGMSVGFKWDKKNSQVENHFWDVQVYNTASKYLYVDIWRKLSPKYKDLTWSTWCELMGK